MSTPAQFGRVARAYRWLEYLSFGPWLARCHALRLPEMLFARSALVLGDGDGRFLAQLAQAAPQMRITAVDASSRMLQAAARRLARGGACAHVSLRQADALQYVPEHTYELVVSHFFLDCFEDAEIARLLQQLRPAAHAGTVWVISDFAVPPGAALGGAGRLLVQALYLAFGLLTGLKTRRLPSYASQMRAAGWSQEDRRCLLGGLLASERWRFQGKVH
jgi:ubiquinone/menaquinone biosynthesis C-methylase UbiE